MIPRRTMRMRCFGVCKTRSQCSLRSTSGPEFDSQNPRESRICNLWAGKRNGWFSRVQWSLGQQRYQVLDPADGTLPQTTLSRVPKTGPKVDRWPPHVHIWTWTYTQMCTFAQSRTPAAECPASLFWLEGEHSDTTTSSAPKEKTGFQTLSTFKSFRLFSGFSLYVNPKVQPRQPVSTWKLYYS